MLFIQYDEKGFGFFQVTFNGKRCGGGYERKYKTIRRKLRFDEDGNKRVFYNGELRSFSIAHGINESVDFKKMLEFYGK